MNDREIEAHNLTKSPETVLEEFAREVQGISSRIETSLYMFSNKQASNEYKEHDLQGISSLVKALNSSVALVEIYLDHKRHTKLPQP